MSLLFEGMKVGVIYHNLPALPVGDSISVSYLHLLELSLTVSHKPKLIGFPSTITLAE